MLILYSTPEIAVFTPMGFMLLIEMYLFSVLRFLSTMSSSVLGGSHGREREQNQTGR